MHNMYLYMYVLLHLYVIWRVTLLMDEIHLRKESQSIQENTG